MNPAVFTTFVLAAFVLGAGCGVYIALYAFNRGAEYQRTGRVRPVPGVVPFVPGGEHAKPTSTGRPGSVERSRADEAFSRVVERGANELMSLEPALTRDQARRKARAALEETGAFNPMGGIPSV